MSTLRLNNDYLSNRNQRTKIENTFSTWLDIISGVSQGSILGPQLFIVFLADWFFTVNDINIASYADENTPYMIANGRVSMNVDGFKIDKKLTFDDHIFDICKKEDRKVSALPRVTPHIGTAKKCILMNAVFYFATSQFTYYPLVSLCHSRTNNNKINRLQERYLRIVYNDKQSSVNELLEKDGSVSTQFT